MKELCSILGRVVSDSVKLMCDSVLQVVTHSATFDFWPATRHALRATPHGEKPLSVAEYQALTGKTAKDRQVEIWKQQGVDVSSVGVAGLTKSRYND